MSRGLTEVPTASSIYATHTFTATPLRRPPLHKKSPHWNRRRLGSVGLGSPSLGYHGLPTSMTRPL